VKIYPHNVIGSEIFVDTSNLMGFDSNHMFHIVGLLVFNSSKTKRKNESSRMCKIPHAMCR
jgi:hypothetical protein